MFKLELPKYILRLSGRPHINKLELMFSAENFDIYNDLRPLFVF